MALAIDPTASPVGEALTRTHHGFALEAIGTRSLILPQVALEGPQKRLIAINDRRVAMALTLSWGSPEGSLTAAQNSANLPPESS